MNRALPESVLVVRLGAIGDVTNALAFATALKDADPRVRIGWAAHPGVLPLLEGHPSVDRVHVWPRGAGWRGWRRMVGELRAERYALAVDLQRIAKSALLARASGAPRVLGYDRGRAKELSWLWTRERIPAGPPRAHMVEQVLEFARHLGVPDPQVRRLLPPDPAADRWAREAVAGLGGPPILVNLGASKPENRWPAERFGRLAQELQAEQGPVALIGGPEDREAAERARAEAGEGVVDFVGKTSLRQLYCLMDRSRLFVGCDTGPMHLAAARELRVVALFGPADPHRTGPWGEGHRILRRPPYDPHSPLPPARTADLEVREVLDAVCAALGGP